MSSFIFKYQNKPLFAYNSGICELKCPYCQTLYGIVSDKLQATISNLVASCQFDLQTLIMRCIHCELYTTTYPFIRNDPFKLNTEQRKVIYELYQEILLTTVNTDPHKLLLIEGYAGTGKTSLITYFLKYPEFRNYQTCLAAPTNQALNVLVEKLNSSTDSSIESTTDNDQIDLDMTIDSDTTDDKPQWEFKTIFKLLNHKMTISASGETSFDSGNSKGPIKSKYEIIVIDESSMIDQKQVMEIMNFANSIKRDKPTLNTSNYPTPTIIFLGDAGQLPPIKEDVGLIFDAKVQKQYSIYKWTLTEIMRSQNQITNLALKIRELIPMDLNQRYQKDISCIDLKKLICDQIAVFTNKNEWIQQYTSDFRSNLECQNKSLTAPIILTYTNNECETLNQQCREVIFNSPQDKYVENELLIFNSHYSLSRTKTTSETAKKSYYLKFYTSQTTIINRIDSSQKVIDRFDLTTLLRSPKLLIDKMTRKINKSGVSKAKMLELTKTVNDLLIQWLFDQKTGLIVCHDPILTRNLHKLSQDIRKLNHTYDIYQLNIDGGGQLDINDTDPTNCAIQTIKDTSFDLYQANIADLKYRIRSSYEMLNNSYKQNLIMKLLIELIFQDIWRDYYYQKYIWPFADVSYGYCITTHKSQGSTYRNVYLNIANIMGCKKVNDLVKSKSLYVGVGRASHLVRIHTNQMILLPFTALSQSFKCQDCGHTQSSTNFPSTNLTIDFKCADQLLNQITPMTMYSFDDKSCVYADIHRNLYQIPLTEIEDVHINDAIIYINQKHLHRLFNDRYVYSNLMLIKEVLMLNRL